MPRRTRRIVKMTHAWIDEIQPAAKREDWYDTETLGLLLRVGTSGSKVFYWRGRIAGQVDRLRLGTYPAMNLAEARRDAKQITGDAAIGRAPKARATVARDEPTFHELWEWYFENHSVPHKRSWRKDKSNYTNHLMHLGPRKISAITTSLLTSLHIEIRDKSGPSAANIAIDLVHGVFTKTQIPLQHGQPDPTNGIRRFAKGERSRFLNGNELPLFLDAVYALGNKMMRDVVLVALFTGARRSNVCAMEWDRVDLQTGMWDISASGFKTKKASTIVLPKAVIALLKKRKKNASSKWVFPSYGITGHIVEPKHTMKKLLKATGIEDLTFHDLRRTLGSWQAAQGTSMQIIGKSLGHASARSTRIYARLDLEPVRAAVEQATAAMAASRKKRTK